MEPRIPVVSNVDATPHSDPEVIKAILVKQVGRQCPPLQPPQNNPTPSMQASGWQRPKRSA